jgi:zinc/manganese transport system substrate-binding protein
MKQLRNLNYTVLAATILLTAITSFAGLRVVASVPDFGSIASYIGGSKVTVSAIASANANPHSVEVFPSSMAKVSRASIYFKCGLALDQWADGIINGSHNSKLAVVDCSVGIRVLEKPTGKVDASKGDVHPDGNPHYWLDPANGLIVAATICKALSDADQGNSAYYEANLKKFDDEYAAKSAVWKKQMQGFQNAAIVSYHSSWVYFVNAFGLRICGMAEPFPGIPPSGAHLAELVNSIRNNHAVFMLQEPYFKNDAGAFLNRQTGIPVIQCAPSCTNVDLESYFAHFNDIINKITALRKG